MKRRTSLLVALMLTLLVAAPAAAAKPVVEFEDLPFGFEEQVNPAWGWVVCPFDIWYGSYGTESLKFWYPKGADPATDPWTKGLYQRAGMDYFSTAPEMGGNVVSGKFRFNSHMNDLVLGDPPSWTETVAGKYWGIQVPGKGNVYHESGNVRQTVLATGATPDDWEYTELRDPRGNYVFDPAAICEALAG